METAATSRSRSQMRWILIAFEALLLLWLLSYTFMVPGDWDHSRLDLTLGLGGAAGVCACSSVLVIQGSGVSLRRLLAAPQVVVFILLMTPVLLSMFAFLSR
jgi:hypothetical protein